MKKTILLHFALLCSTTFNYSFSSTGKPLLPAEPTSITTLIINANVTVVLVNNDKLSLEMAKGNGLTRLVTLKRANDTLVIGSANHKDLKGAGFIYVPATELRKIQINSGANVRSLNALNIPKLDVVINGACQFAISNLGEVNLTGTDNYTIEHTTEVRPYPVSMLGRKE